MKKIYKERVDIMDKEQFDKELLHYRKIVFDLNDIEKKPSRITEFYYDDEYYIVHMMYGKVISISKSIMR